MILVCFHVKSSNITVTQVYAKTTDAEKAEVDWFYEDLQHLLELTPKKKKKSPFHHRRLKCKSRKSRDSQNNRQVWPCTKWSRAKINRILSREHAGHSKHPFPTTQKITLHIHRWSILKSDYYVVCSLDRQTLYSQQRNTWSWLWLRSYAPDCKTQA